jgi:hypothetical protein
LTTASGVGIFTNTCATLLLNERHILSEDAFVEIVVWRLTSPVSGSRHAYKYRLALISKEVYLLRYDNETGKGDHKHVGEKEMPLLFTTPEKPLDDFWDDVDQWRS